LQIFPQRGIPWLTTLSFDPIIGSQEVLPRNSLANAPGRLGFDR
jgi:hypothetical protein